ncbi:hypothetical protein GCM10010211_34030 [Streptomyces albospinus]|uniref:VOC domain-containing protein n=2 Tax=Streptomyces albospinus TaxID=285515 RepID=A0ABQ2V3W9_9ACTN|nr:hypothetical protein GCM10010211_34030 [Streptomyces albospinus]
MPGSAWQVNHPCEVGRPNPSRRYVVRVVDHGEAANNVYLHTPGHLPDGYTTATITAVRHSPRRSPRTATIPKRAARDWSGWTNAVGDPSPPVCGSLPKNRNVIAAACVESVAHSCAMSVPHRQCLVSLSGRATGGGVGGVVSVPGAASGQTRRMGRGHGRIDQESRSAGHGAGSSLLDMNITIHTSSLPHDDPDASLAFYRDVLGFEVRSDVGQGRMRWITVGPAGQPDTSLLLAPPAADPGVTEDERRTISEMMAKGTYGWILLATPDLDATFEKVQAGDTEVVQEPTEQPYGIRDCAFRDPAGNLVRIQELR